MVILSEIPQTETMNIFNDYAALYDVIGQSAFSERMARQTLDWITRQGWDHAALSERRMLDLACGTGAAALIFATAGFEVIGIDRSPAMLRHAQRRAEQSQMPITFLRCNMRHLVTDQDITSQSEYLLLSRHSFDLITCFGGSLHYLIGDDDLQWVCSGVAELLKPGGFFLFDLISVDDFNTLDERDQVIYDDHNYLVYQRLNYDPQRRLTTRRIGWFTREIERWWRSEETHVERAWSNAEVQTALSNAHPPLHVLAQLPTVGYPHLDPSSRLVYYTMAIQV